MFPFRIAFGQGIKSLEIKDKSLKSILGFVDTVIFKRYDDISIILYKVSNQSGSAHLEGSDEVSHKYLIVVSSYDEDPEQHLYSVGNFYNPKILKFEKQSKDNYRILFEYGVFRQRKKSFINVSLKNVSVTLK